jgi:hypothetical protein
MVDKSGANLASTDLAELAVELLAPLHIGIADLQTGLLERHVKSNPVAISLGIREHSVAVKEKCRQRSLRIADAASRDTAGCRTAPERRPGRVATDTCERRA